MKNTESKQNTKAAYKFSLIAICVFYALYFVTVPIFLNVSVNAIYKNTLIPNLVKFAGKVFEVCGIAVCYAIVLFSVYKQGKSAYGRAYLLYGISAFVKCSFAQTVYWVKSGGVPAFNNGFFEEALWNIALPFALEMLQFTLFFLIAKKFVIRYRQAYIEAKDASRARGTDYPEMDRWVYPFKSTFDFRNPLLRGGLIGGIVIWVSKTISSVISEIDMALNGLAIKTLGDFLGSALKFASDIACGVLAYTVMVFIIIKSFELTAKDRK